MAARKSKQNKLPDASAQGLARLAPTQQRSRERFERILECATKVMAQKGSEGFRMSDIVERAGVSFGSLYQYFPDKTAIIGTLAERYNAVGRICVQKELATVKVAKDMHPALSRIVDGFYQMYVDEPVMRDIWQATQADRTLQKLDDDDGIFLSGLLHDALARITPRADVQLLSAQSQLTMTLIAAAVRHAITLPPKDAARVLTLFKHMLPKNSPGLA